MFDILWNLMFFVVALGVLITFHEFGHFWVARRCGVKVLRFSIGFGKPLASWTDRLGTEYVIAAIPLGGYVKMLDERVDDVAEDELDQAFNQKSVLQRIAIVAAGPLANIILAIVAFWLMFVSGVQTVHPIITGASVNSIAAEAGIDRQMQIVAVDGQETPDWETVNLAFVAKIGGQSLTIQTQDLESSARQEYRLDLASWKFDPEKETAVSSLGLEPFRPHIELLISNVEAGSPADTAGFMVGDLILGVDGDSISRWEDIATRIQGSPLRVLTFQIERDSQVLDIQATPGERRVRGEYQGFLGIAPTVQSWPDNFVFELSYGVFESVEKAVDRTWQLISLSISMIGKLITGDVSVKNLSGPISIAQGAGASASFGFVYFLGFVALISVNIGIINLLPLPVLDGGHLLYYFIELLTGKPVPQKVQEVGFRIGSFALLMLMGLALFNDFSRL
ncbi:sigma E protease regulator RseP [Echinimonas agarilytica]|uniref:Zinc metalloprotease n=1 Tax=Echinimonas agarilytica TaxID=1215918 RepID=A0AA41W5J1_9GAMM|nr:sigma E protease regulator RseP [Echinimonas agarilytica]MCM2679131.1 sigma E protease regulator RseP [Echinimonas agarilytica]